MFMKKVKICILLVMCLFIFCSCESEENSQDNFANVQMTENVQESDEKESNITADNQDETTTTDEVSKPTERNPENILPADKVSVVEQTGFMDQVATDEEKNEIINIIFNLSAEDYKNAIEYDKNSREIIEGDHLVVITSNESGDITIYGYKGSKYYSRGIIVDNKGVKSYFDYSWSEQRERRKIYEADFDKDGIEEVAFIMAGGHGTGVSVERLIIFEPMDESGQFIAYEFTGETLQQEFEKIYDFQVDIGNWELRVIKDGNVERILDWENSSSYYRDGEFQIDYLNLISYEILDEKILMNMEVCIRTNIGGPGKGFPNDGGKFCFNVAYENGMFRLE